MATAGIAIYNNHGVPINTIDDKTTYCLGSGSTGTGSGSLTDNRIANKKVWIIVVGFESDGGDLNPSLPKFSVNGATISWTMHNMKNISTIINTYFMYGVY